MFDFFVEAVWMWVPLPTRKWLNWKTQCGLSLAHLKEKWDKWTTGQTINALFCGRQHDFSLRITGEKPDHSSRQAGRRFGHSPDRRDQSRPRLRSFLLWDIPVIPLCKISGWDGDYMWHYTAETLSSAAEWRWCGHDEKEALKYGFFFGEALLPPLCPIMKGSHLLMRAATTQTDSHTHGQQHFIT